MEEEITLCWIIKLEFPHWFSNSLRCTIKKRITFTDDLRRKNPTVFAIIYPFIWTVCNVSLRVGLFGFDASGH
jgi:hypothetical protein